MDHQLTTLPNGLRVVSTHMPHVQTAAIGVWVDAGARNELLKRAIASEHGLAQYRLKISDDMLMILADIADGDARRAVAPFFPPASLLLPVLAPLFGGEGSL